MEPSPGILHVLCQLQDRAFFWTGGTTCSGKPNALGIARDQGCPWNGTDWAGQASGGTAGVGTTACAAGYLQSQLLLEDGVP